MRKIIFVLLASLLTLAGCGKEALPETSSVPSEDTHINQPFGRVASAQIGMKACRQTAAFLVKLC